MIPETEDEKSSPQTLERGLKGRHIQLIAIGGTIGVGLFLGSAKAIQTAGPALILDYVFGGTLIFFMMRALGELLLYRPVAGSFAEYAEEFVGPFAGFATGWSYWFMWVTACMAEGTAIGIYFHYWFPEIPQWLSALSVLLVLYALNRLAVGVFGEVEFWFALIKVLTIVGLIVIGMAVLVLKFGATGHEAKIGNLWEHGGFFPFGVVGIVAALQITMFAYSGVEMIGVTAGEAANPMVVLPRATNSIIVRILIFYIGSLIVIMSLIPWTEIGRNVSPFVLVFERLGIPGAGNIMNIVVITAAASSCNSGLYSTGRMLFALANKGSAPRSFSIVNKRHVPIHAVNFSAAVMFIGVVLNYLVPGRAFIWLTSITLVGTLWTWTIIMLAHRGYRKAVRSGAARAVSFRMPGAPVTTWFVLGGVVFTAAMLWFDSETRVALFVGPVWFAVLGMAFHWKRRRAPHEVAAPG